jgi:hypothetical protein
MSLMFRMRIIAATAIVLGSVSVAGAAQIQTQTDPAGAAALFPGGTTINFEATAAGDYRP